MVIRIETPRFLNYKIIRSITEKPKIMVVLLLNDCFDNRGIV